MQMHFPGIFGRPYEDEDAAAKESAMALIEHAFKEHQGGNKAGASKGVGGHLPQALNWTFS